METILVTGSQGFFASRFILYYKDKYNVIGLSRKELDITDEKQTADMILKCSPDYVVHAAAISDTGTCERNPEDSYEINVRGSLNVAKGCQRANAKMIFFSSDQVYNGSTEGGPYSEDSIISPAYVYGKHKMMAERELLEISPETVALRLTWMFSLPERNRRTNSNIIWNIVKAAMKNEPVKVPVNEYRGITYVYDLIENFESIFHLSGGIYNTGSENNLSTYEVAQIVLKKIGLESRISEILIKDIESYKGHCKDLRISNSKLKNNNIPFTDTEHAVEKCLKDFRCDAI